MEVNKMSVNKVTITQERVIDVDKVLKVLKDKSRNDIPGMLGSTAEVDKELLKDAALVIENFRDRLDEGKKPCTGECKKKDDVEKAMNKEYNDAIALLFGVL